jgi:hypothetical protein
MNDDITDGEKQDFQFLELCRLLNEHGVHYLICGGYACILHGNLRMTQDVDLLVEESKENYARLITALSLFGDGSAKELTEADIDENLVVKINDVITIDVSRRAWVVTYAEAAPNALKEEIEGVEIPYLGLKDLIRSKQTYRDKDRLDIQQLMRLPDCQRDGPPDSTGSDNVKKPAKGCLGIVSGFMVLCFVIFVWLSLASFSRADEVTSAEFTVDTLDISGSGGVASAEFTVNTLSTNGSVNGVASGDFTVETRALDAPRSYDVSGPSGFTVDTRRYPNALPLTINGTVVDLMWNPVNCIGPQQPVVGNSRNPRA